MSDQPDPVAKATCTHEARCGNLTALCGRPAFIFTYEGTWCEKHWKEKEPKAICSVQIRDRLDDVYTHSCGLPAVESGPHGAWCEKHWDQGVKAPQKEEAEAIPSQCYVCLLCCSASDPWAKCLRCERPVCDRCAKVGTTAGGIMVPHLCPTCVKTVCSRKFTCVMCCGVVEIAYRDNKGVDYCLPCWWSNKYAASLSSEQAAAVTRAQKDADAALGAVAGLAKQMLTLEEGISEAFRLIDKQQDRLDAMNGHQTLTLGEGVGRISWRNAPTLCSRPGCSSDGEYHTTYAGTLCTEHAREYGQGAMVEEKTKWVWLPHWTLVAAVLSVSGATAVLVWQVAEMVAVHWR